MKTLKISTIAIIFFLATSIAQAQIKPRIPGQSRAHSKALSEAQKIGAKERRKFLNQKKDDGLKAIDKSMHNGLPATYEFAWKYTLQIQNKKKVMNINYFLKSNATYVGFKLETKAKKNSNVGFMIMDSKRKKSLILMDIGNNKRLIATKLPTQVQTEKENKYTITKIGTKVILGYTCQGYKIVSKDGVATTYVLENAPVNFNQIYNVKAKNSPKGFNPAWLKQIKNGLVMEMDFKSSKKKKYDTKMKCVALKKESKTINLRTYTFFGN